MTPAQRELARHALGLPNPNRRSYRNYFTVNPALPECAEWRRMVDAGYATERRASVLSDDLVFHLTPKGIRAAVEMGEVG